MIYEEYQGDEFEKYDLSDEIGDMMLSGHTGSSWKRKAVVWLIVVTAIIALAILFTKTAAA